MLFWLINKTSKIPRRIIGVPHEWYCCATLVRKDKLKNSTKCGKLVETILFPIRVLASSTIRRYPCVSTQWPMSYYALVRAHQCASILVLEPVGNFNWVGRRPTFDLHILGGLSWLFIYFVIFVVFDQRFSSYVLTLPKALYRHIKWATHFIFWPRPPVWSNVPVRERPLG